MLLGGLRIAVRLAAVFALAAMLTGCGGDEVMRVKYPLIWAGIVAGGPSGEWLWGDCDAFAPPRRQAQLCEQRRQAAETPAERAARLARAEGPYAVCLASLAERTCHPDVVHVLPGRE